MEDLKLIHPGWPAPSVVRACTTTRHGGVSRPPWDSLNLGGHVGDDPADVEENRRRLRTALALPAEPAWLNQIHSRHVVEAGAWATPPDADASVTREPGVVCAVMTADCLPVLFCADDGGEVAAAHAGWRGLAGGVLEAALAAMTTPNARVMAWLGPAIGPQAFEVGDEVREAFVSTESGAADAFIPHGPGHWLADLYALARLRLQRAGVTRIFGGDRCTYTERDFFYSYRRDGTTGRMASLIWIEPK